MWEMVVKMLQLLWTAHRSSRLSCWKGKLEGGSHAGICDRKEMEQRGDFQWMKLQESSEGSFRR